jgi:hypothetical protein
MELFENASRFDLRAPNRPPDALAVDTDVHLPRPAALANLPLHCHSGSSSCANSAVTGRLDGRGRADGKSQVKSISCPGGGIGRRTRFRVWRSQGRAGSSPVPGTTSEALASTALFASAQGRGKSLRSLEPAFLHGIRRVRAESSPCDELAPQWDRAKIGS